MADSGGFGFNAERQRSSMNNTWGLAPISPESQFGLSEMQRLYQNYNPSPLAQMLSGTDMTGVLKRGMADYMDPMSSESVTQPYNAFKQQSELDLNKTLAGLSGNAQKYGMVGSRGDAQIKADAVTGQQSTLANLLSQLVLGARSGGIAGINSMGNMAQIGENTNLTPFTLAMALRNATAPNVLTGSSGTTSGTSFGAKVGFNDLAKLASLF